MENNIPLKVAIADDDTFLLDMYSIKFKKSGMDVSTFPRVEDLLTQIREKVYSPDIIILDMVMPKIDGIAALEILRKDNLSPEVCTIILSNQGQPSDIEKAEALGIDGYIIKALTIPSEVVEEVKKIYAKKKSK